jgi:uncharacterized membrane protein
MRIGECLEFGWETFKRHAGAFVLVTLALLVVQALLNAVFSTALKGALGSAATLMISGLFSGGFMAAAREGARGHAPTLSDAFRPFTHRQGDFLIVGLAINVGLLACGVGIFVTSFLFLFAPLCVVEGADFKSALVRSKDLVTASVGEAIVFVLVLAAVNMAGALALGVGLLITIPISSLAVVKAYELASTPAVLPPPSAWHPASEEPPSGV